MQNKKYRPFSPSLPIHVRSLQQIQRMLRLHLPLLVPETFEASVSVHATDEEAPCITAHWLNCSWCFLHLPFNAKQDSQHRTELFQEYAVPWMLLEEIVKISTEQGHCWPFECPSHYGLTLQTLHSAHSWEGSTVGVRREQLTFHIITLLK